ncbi:MAG: hypothetical protein QW083_00495 [Methanomassiliicoccales archaeon]
MKVLIMMTGRSVWGGFNSVWAMIRNYNFIPQLIYILTTEEEQEQAAVLEKLLPNLVGAYGSQLEIKIEVLRSDEIRTVSNKVRSIATMHKQNGDVVALEVTPGRKIFVLGSVFAGWDRYVFDFIFYLYIDSLFKANRPYLLIPLSCQHLHEIISEAK